MSFLSLQGGQALADGKEPDARNNTKAFCNRPGSWHSAPEKSPEVVRMERFQNPLGRVLNKAAAAAE
jgi:hypothetical protein